MNIITLTGNSTKDIELRYSQSGKAVGNGSIAVRRNFKNQDGEYETDFFNFVTFGKQAEIMAEYIRKGDKFGITGNLQNRVWEKDDGQKRYFTEVMVSGFDFPDKPKQERKRQSNQQQNNQQTQHKPSYTQKAPKQDDRQLEPLDISDDDLPF